jgi:hypothetical protein
MKIALVTTTINVPDVLKLYQQCNESVRVVVAMDRKSVDPRPDLGQFVWLTPIKQEAWKCSDLIGWNCIQRRNIAFLEALSLGAEIIVSIDDDNIPMQRNYFDHYEFGLSSLFSGPMIKQPHRWFDAGQFLFANGGKKVVQRGYPQEFKSEAFISFATRAKVGVMQGTCLGDPDTSAVDRTSQHPLVHQTSELLRTGFIVEGGCYAPFNSQNVAILREFVPAFFLWPNAGRYDDIYASLLTQRVMREYDHHVHFGQPFVWQQRNSHNLIKDLRGEIDGMENIIHLAEVLDHVQLIGDSVIDDCRRIWDTLSNVSWVSERTVAAARAYLDDCEIAIA